MLTNAAGLAARRGRPGRADGDHRPHQHDGRQRRWPAPTTTTLGPRFPSLRDAYDPRAARAAARGRAASSASTLHEGVYLAVDGPSFETPAEIHAFRTLGADAVGMSTVHETIVARHCGLRVVAVSAITNLAEGMQDEPLSHEQTLRDAARAAARPRAAASPASSRA